MAHKYVWSAAAGAADGSSWANAYTTLKAGAEAAGTAASDNIWVAHDSAEAGAVPLTIAFKGTPAAPGTVACVNRAGSVPPVAADLRTTASVTATGNSGIGLTAGAMYLYGMAFNAGSGAVNASLAVQGTMKLENCLLAKLGTTSIYTAIALGMGGGNPCAIELINTQLQFGNVADLLSIRHADKILWRNTAVPIAGAIIPNPLVSRGNDANQGDGILEFRDIDLSQFASKTLMTYSGGPGSTTYLNNCKLGASCVIVSGMFVECGEVILFNCDSGATNYRTEKYRFEGTQVIETAIVRTGGASDGVTPVSWKIVTNANAKWIFPFESLPLRAWNDASGPRTVSVYGYWNNASAPLNDDIWIEADYLGSAASPIGSFISSSKSSFLATGVAIPTDTSVWGGGAGTTKFKMSVNVPALMKGLVVVRVKVGKPSATFYVDPKLEVL